MNMGSRLVSHPRARRVGVHPGRKAGRPVKVAAKRERREPAGRRELVQAQPAPLVKPNTKRKKRLRKDLPLLRRSNSVEQLRKPRPRILSKAVLCTRSPVSNIWNYCSFL